MGSILPNHSLKVRFFGKSCLRYKQLRISEQGHPHFCSGLKAVIRYCSALGHRFFRNPPVTRHDGRGSDIRPSNSNSDHPSKKRDQGAENDREPAYPSCQFFDNLAFWIVWLAMLVTTFPSLHFHHFCDFNCADFKVRASLSHLKSSIHAVGFHDRKP